MQQWKILTIASYFDISLSNTIYNVNNAFSDCWLGGESHKACFGAQTWDFDCWGEAEAAEEVQCGGQTGCHCYFELNYNGRTSRRPHMLFL